MDNMDTLGVLQALERGEINVEQAEGQLSGASPVGAFHELPHQDETEYTRPPRWVQRFWVYPLVAGIALVFLGAWIIMATVSANILWFIFGLPIVLLGALITALAAIAQTAHWLYVDVHESGRRRSHIQIALPFSLSFLRAGLWFARPFLRQPRPGFTVHTDKPNLVMDWDDADGFLKALEKELTAGHGMTIDVDDKNAQVRVYLV
jgi:hypothetical protein